jgi:putative DNA primase/helicase
MTGTPFRRRLFMQYYPEWANRNGEWPLNMKELKNKLVELFDLTHKRSRRGSDWVGVKFRM